MKVLVPVNPITSPSLNISYPNKSGLTLSSTSNVNLIPFSTLFKETSKFVS